MPPRLAVVDAAPSRCRRACRLYGRSADRWPGASANVVVVGRRRRDPVVAGTGAARTRP